MTLQIPTGREQNLHETENNNDCREPSTAKLDKFLNQNDGSSREETVSLTSEKQEESENVLKRTEAGAEKNGTVPASLGGMQQEEMDGALVTSGKTHASLQQESDNVVEMDTAGSDKNDTVSASLGGVQQEEIDYASTTSGMTHAGLQQESDNAVERAEAVIKHNGMVPASFEGVQQEEMDNAPTTSSTTHVGLQQESENIVEIDTAGTEKNDTVPANLGDMQQEEQDGMLATSDKMYMSLQQESDNVVEMDTAGTEKNDTVPASLGSAQQEEMDYAPTASGTTHAGLQQESDNVVEINKANTEKNSTVPTSLGSVQQVEIDYAHTISGMMHTGLQQESENVVERAEAIIKQNGTVPAIFKCVPPEEMDNAPTTSSTTHAGLQQESDNIVEMNTVGTEKTDPVPANLGGMQQEEQDDTLATSDKIYTGLNKGSVNVLEGVNTSTEQSGMMPKKFLVAQEQDTDAALEIGGKTVVDLKREAASAKTKFSTEENELKIYGTMKEVLKSSDEDARVNEMTGSSTSEYLRLEAVSSFKANDPLRNSEKDSKVATNEVAIQTETGFQQELLKDFPMGSDSINIDVEMKTNCGVNQEQVTRLYEAPACNKKQTSTKNNNFTNNKKTKLLATIKQIKQGMNISRCMQYAITVHNLNRLESILKIFYLMNVINNVALWTCATSLIVSENEHVKEKEKYVIAAKPFISALQSVTKMRYPGSHLNTSALSKQLISHVIDDIKMYSASGNMMFFCIIKYMAKMLIKLCTLEIQGRPMHIIVEDFHLGTLGRLIQEKPNAFFEFFHQMPTNDKFRNSMGMLCPTCQGHSIVRQEPRNFPKFAVFIGCEIPGHAFELFEFACIAEFIFFATSLDNTEQDARNYLP